MDTSLAEIMRDITNCSNGNTQYDQIIAKIEKQARKGNSFIIEKYYDNAHLLIPHINDYAYWLKAMEKSNDSYMQEFYKEQIEKAKQRIPEEYFELVKQNFKFSIDKFCMPIFGRSYYKIKISW